MPDYTGGWDYFTPENADTFEYKYCLVCGTRFDVSKGEYGPTTGGEARVGKAHTYDRLTCQHTGKDWHDQALDILKEAKKTASNNLRKLLQEEADTIAVTKKATIHGYKKKFFS